MHGDPVALQPLFEEAVDDLDHRVAGREQVKVAVGGADVRDVAPCGCARGADPDPPVPRQAGPEPPRGALAVLVEVQRSAALAVGGPARARV
jgi:hypothetical protein